MSIRSVLSSSALMKVWVRAMVGRHGDRAGARRLDGLGEEVADLPRQQLVGLGLR